MFFSLGSQELQHKLALLNSIRDVTCAIQAVDTKRSFGLCKKPEVLEVLLVSACSWGCPQGRLLFPEARWSPPATHQLLSSRSLVPSCWALGRWHSVAGEHGGPVVAVGMKGLVRAQACQQSRLPGRVGRLSVPLPTLSASLCDLQDLMEEDACDTPVSQVHLKMLQLLEQLR